MGDAKRRGTREQRVAQAIERRKLEDAARHERYQREEAERRARIAALPAQERKEAVLTGGGGGMSRLALAALLGVAAPILIVDRETEARS